MGVRSAAELRDELNRLMQEHLDSLRGQVFGGISAEALQEHEQRLFRIREVSADFLAALKRENK
jgi:hypothetical protein